MLQVDMVKNSDPDQEVHHKVERQHVYEVYPCDNDSDEEQATLFSSEDKREEDRRIRQREALLKMKHQDKALKQVKSRPNAKKTAVKGFKTESIKRWAKFGKEECMQ